MKHRFNVGDKVVYTNIFGVCLGVKTIMELDFRPKTRDDDGPQQLTYHYEGTDTPWYSVEEARFKLTDAWDLQASAEELQQKHGFTPTEWYGCY